MRARLLTASMSGLVGGLKKPQILASPRTVDPLFRRIEEVHDEAAQPFGHILDAGTGGHSLKWLGTLPKDAVASVTAVTLEDTFRTSATQHVNVNASLATPTTQAAHLSNASRRALNASQEWRMRGSIKGEGDGAGHVRMGDTEHPQAPNDARHPGIL